MALKGHFQPKTFCDSDSMKLCEASTNLLSQHFSIASARQKREDTAAYESAFSSYFRVNR